jgi:[FeFe] hydrogenase H-cluster maturation GTPase HydF
MQDTPKGLRLHIGLYGRRNVGKSSLVNVLIGQDVSIVSNVPGTTTDPVEKAMEMAPIGPVLFIDTAGIDDSGPLGELRKERTTQSLDRTDVALLVTGPEGLAKDEERLIALFREKSTPFCVVFNKADLSSPLPHDIERLARDKIDWVAASAVQGSNLNTLKELIIHLAPEDRFVEPHLVGDLLRPGDLVVLVVPIDLGAPKGRLILPQVMAIRDILDSDAVSMMVKERELRDALAQLGRKPKLVVCDSQVVLKAAADTPPDILLTTFSILMARLKGDLVKFAEGAAAINRLKPGDKILIAESCTHHPLADDIGRVKIPRWLRQYAGGDLLIENVAGRDFPDDLTPYALVIQCGGCTANRKQMLSRLHQATNQGVPMTNYGVAISLVQGVLPRALECFPAARHGFDRAMATKNR